jgi:pimeloyl-ACP methyl ester carboxylesterase
MISDTKKTLVLLPGLDGTGLLFKPLLEHLSTNFRTHVINYPTNIDLTPIQLANEVLKQVVFNKDTVLLAESFSGLVALELLKKNIALSHIIFCASFFSAPRPLLLKSTQVISLSHFFNWKIPKNLLVLSGLNQVTIELLHQAQNMVSGDILAKRLNYIANTQQADTTYKWSIPCTYLQADEDWAVPQSNAHIIKDYFVDFHLHKLGPSGHFLLQTQPKLCAVIIHKIMANV